MDSKTAALKLRDAKPNEWGTISRLLVAAYQQYKKGMPPDTWHWYRQDMMDVRGRMADSELIVAEINRQIVGTVTFYPPGSSHGWPEDWAGIRLLGVHPSYRGHGIGRALMDECLRRCRDKGTKTIGLHTSYLMVVALGLYERMGFKRIPEYDFRPDPDRVVYAYRLDL